MLHYKKIILKYKKSLFVLAGIGFLFLLGLFFGLYSWNQNLYVSWSPAFQRGLAEDSQSEVLLNISANQVVEKANEVLFQDIRLIEEEDSLTFYLGSVLVPDKASGQYRFLCEIFSHVEFSFTPVGVLLSGDPGLMILQSPCRQEEELELGPFFIPKKEILASPEKNSFTFEEAEDYISFYKASVVLTPSWLLTTIRFFNTNQENSREFIVRYNPESNTPFEVKLKKETPPPQLILKEYSM